MNIKRILVPLPSSVDHTGEIDMALSAAKAFKAHVEALFISQPPPSLDRGYVEKAEFVSRPSLGIRRESYFGATSMYERTSAALAPIDWYAEERDKIAREARERFTHACRAVGLPVLSANVEPDAGVAASWREAEGSYVEIAVERAAAFDLMVAASAGVMESLKTIAERTLLQTRRPVLLAPARLETALTDSAMIAWDASPECWHAVSAALPFLHIAKSVLVISVDWDASRRTDSQAEVLAYLHCHGIAAIAKVVEPHLRSAATTLLATAAEHNAGLLVMGAYSHSRLREMLLGGATRHILNNGSTRPILLAH
jgi:nucleotide-binding universal stress UspA family protein